MRAGCSQAGPPLVSFGIIDVMLALICVMTLIVLANASAFVLFMFDKHCAEERLRRVPESTLLLVAFVGGSAGAIAGQHYWRHKTQKEPFRTMLLSIAGIHAAALGWWLVR
jgi:uncharacterized membrane protein YsdA (DUF1294 family)